MSVVFHDRNVNLVELIENNGGVVAVYGTTLSSSLTRQTDFEFDYFVDKRAKELGFSLDGKPCIELSELNKIIEDSGKRGTVVLCLGYSPSGALHSIYSDICQRDINVDVINYFDNRYFFGKKNFFIKGAELPLYEHPFNCFYTDIRMTERSVELSLAIKWLSEIDGDVMEIGAVTPYYFNDSKIDQVVDPTDTHYKVNISKSLFDVDIKEKNILSISTIEHIGTNDYGMNESRTSVDALKYIMDNAKHYLITVPIGYNKGLDNWIRINRKKITILQRFLNNNWHEISETDPLYYEVYNGWYADELAIISH